MLPVYKLVGRGPMRRRSSVREFTALLTPRDFTVLNVKCDDIYNDHFCKATEGGNFSNKITTSIRTVHFDGGHSYDDGDMGMYSTSEVVHTPHKGFTSLLSVNNVVKKSGTATIEMELLTELDFAEPNRLNAQTMSWIIKGTVSCDLNGRVTDTRDLYIDPKTERSRYLERMNVVSNQVMQQSAGQKHRWSDVRAVAVQLSRHVLERSMVDILGAVMETLKFRASKPN